MGSRITLLSLAVAAACVAGVAMSDDKDDQAKKHPVVEIGKTETAKWSATTYEAAASEANKKVLEEGKQTTVTGEVVDVSCYLQLGKRGEAHVPCGTKCIKNGQPIGIVDDDDLYILFAEEHHPRRDGTVSLKSVFLPLLAKNVTVTGMMTEMKGYKALFVQAAEAQKMMKAKPATPKAK